jgi:hypothetical protein
MFEKKPIEKLAKLARNARQTIVDNSDLILTETQSMAQHALWEFAQAWDKQGFTFNKPVMAKLQQAIQAGLTIDEAKQLYLQYVGMNNPNAIILD